MVFNHAGAGGGAPMRLSAAAVAVLALSLSACSSSPQREYDIPTSLCGTTISPDLLKPFLPAGKKVRVEDSPSRSERSCSVLVDDKEAVTLGQSWWPEGTPAHKVQDDNPGLKPLKKEAEGGHFAYTDTNAVRLVPCTAAQAGHGMLYADGWTSGSGDEAAMRKLISAYSEASVKKCAQSDHPYFRASS